MIGAALGLALAPLAVPWIKGRPDQLTEAVRAQVAPGDTLAGYYLARNSRPLWVVAGRIRPEATRVIAILRNAAADDLDPAAYQVARLTRLVDEAGERPRPASLAGAEVALSRAWTHYVADLHDPPADAALRFVDPAVRLPPDRPTAILTAAAAAPSLDAAINAARRMNPIYVALRQAFDANRGGPNAHLIAANLERARALPPDLGSRFLLVNPAAQTLTLYAGGAPAGVMRVVIGMLDNQTPSMIGLVRFVLYSPYWNVPPDLVRDDIAPAVMRDGIGYFAAHHFEALSDFSPSARPLDPASIDWAAVADGVRPLRVRQLPGPDNVMGRVKFMLPNPLGIYLHDTPDMGLFGRPTRTDSHGCVRLQHAEHLAAWLLSAAPPPGGGADRKVDLATPAPVYIVYLTAAPEHGGLVFLPDIYRRDPALESELAARSRPPARIPTKSLVDQVRPGAQVHA